VSGGANLDEESLCRTSVGGGPRRHGQLDKLLRSQNGLSALPTREGEHFGKAWEQIYRPAMRAHFAGNIEADFQVGQRLPNIRRRNGANHGTAFIADNISLFPANDAVQAAAAVRIAKV
jgi:hypothetical protein